MLSRASIKWEHALQRRSSLQQRDSRAIWLGVQVIMALSTLGVVASTMLRWPLDDHFARLGAIGFGTWCAFSVLHAVRVYSGRCGCALSKGNGQYKWEHSTTVTFSTLHANRWCLSPCTIHTACGRCEVVRPLLHQPARVCCNTRLVFGRYASYGQAAIWENRKFREYLVAKREKFRRMMKVQ